jgi:hypothetical protein
MSAYRIDGPGLLKQGLCATDTVIDGTGLLTFGLIWSCFSPFDWPIGVTYTAWTTSPGVTSTTWSTPSGGIYGPC